MSVLNLKNQLLIAGILFTLHNIEESIGFAHFQYHPDFPLAVQPPSANSMILAIGLITIIVWVLIMWANTQPKESSRRNLLIILVSVFLFNAIFPHITGTIVLQRYFPAVITSLILYIPYSIWILPKLYRSVNSRNDFFLIMTGGLSLAVVLTLITHFFVNIYFRYLAN
jgi:hypothetical protein